jgi:RsfA family transcription factor
MNSENTILLDEIKTDIPANAQSKGHWTEEEDAILIDLALASFRTGSKRSNAWEKAAELIGRSKGACEYRWNAYLSKDQEDQIEWAKMLFEEKSKYGVNYLDEISENENKSTESLVPNGERIGKTPLVQIPTSICVENEEITTGIQQVIDLETFQITDDIHIPDIVNPFDKITQYVKAIEKEHKTNLQQYEHMAGEYRILASKNSELHGELSKVNSYVAELQTQNMDKDDEIRALKEQLHSLNEIKDLVVQFKGVTKAI